jgi:hypothetical protein
MQFLLSFLKRLMSTIFDGIHFSQLYKSKQERGEVEESCVSTRNTIDLKHEIQIQRILNRGTEDIAIYLTYLKSDSLDDK